MNIRSTHHLKATSLLLLTFTLALLLAGCQMMGQATPTPEGEETLDFQAASIVSATGVVLPARWAALGVEAGGPLAELLVSEGDRVEAGQPLLRLAGGDPQAPSPELQAAIQAAELELHSAQQARDRLPEQAAAALAQAEQGLSQAVVQIHDLQLQLDDLDLPEEQEDLPPLDAYDQARAAYDAAWEAFLPWRDERGESEHWDRKEELDEARDDYDTAARRLQLSLALDAARENERRLREDIAIYQDGPRPADLALADQRLASAQAALLAANAAIQRLTLTAPFGATVSEILVRPGEWLAPGLPVIVLADLDHLQVETSDLNEIDRARLEVGDTATITFDALPDVAIPGQVVYIAPKSSSGVGVNYRAVVSLERLPAELRWGMSAFVDITPSR